MPDIRILDLDGDDVTASRGSSVQWSMDIRGQKSWTGLRWGDRVVAFDGITIFLAEREVDVRGFEQQVFHAFDEAAYYLERATVRNVEAATRLFQKETDDWEDIPEPEPIFMRHTTDEEEVAEVGGEGEEAWLECSEVADGAVPFWKAAL